MRAPKNIKKEPQLDLLNEKEASPAEDYYKNLSQALILYSFFDDKFRSALFESVAQKRDHWESVLDKTENKYIYSKDYYGNINLLIPQSRESAIRKMYWLVEKAVDEDLNGVKLALHKWYEKPNEFPKAIIIGIAVGIIPGFTLGNIKRNTELGIIIQEDFQLGETQLKKILSSSMELMSEAFSLSQNDVKKLEPEIYEWFFGERQIKIFKGNAKTIEDIEIELIKLSVPFKTILEEQKLKGLIISPTVNLSILSSSHDLTETSEVRDF